MITEEIILRTILIVDDNGEYLNTLVKLFETNGYAVDSTLDAVVAIEKAAMKKYDLVISDLVMGAVDGVRLVATLKRIQPDIKSIILTAEPSSVTEIEAISVSVDSYLPKDKSKEVLLKYVERLLGQASTSEVDLTGQQLVSSAENIVMLLDQRKVMKNNQEVDLSFKEFQLLKFFLENKGAALCREEIKKILWDEDIEVVDDRAVDVHIKKLRAKLKTFSIMSIRGFGYKWNER